LLPIVAVFANRFDIGLVGAILGALNVVLLHAALRISGAKWSVATWLAVGFALGSVHWWAAALSDVWNYALVHAVTFMLLALVLALRQRWPVAAGILFGLAAAARLPVGLLVPLYLALYAGVRLPSRGDIDGWRGRLRAAGLPSPAALWQSPRVRGPVLFLLGLAIPASLVALYNVARFGSPTDFGYERIPGVLTEPIFTQGINSITYIPRHIHAMFIRGFDYVDQFPYFRPNWTSLSLLIQTPIFLWLVRARSRDTIIAFAWLAVALALIPIITHGGVGFTQFGYRRSLDFAPVLWLMLGWVFRERMPVEAKAAIVLGVIVNAYGMYAILVMNFVAY
jgi:hypothetical protein